MQGVGVEPALFTLQGYLLLFLAKKYLNITPHILTRVLQTPSNRLAQLAKKD